MDDEQNLNLNLSIQKIHSYIWYSETHQPYSQQSTTQGYLGKCNNTGFYFHYQPNVITTLDDAYLMNVTEACEQYVIYADVYSLDSKSNSIGGFYRKPFGKLQFISSTSALPPAATGLAIF